VVFIKKKVKLNFFFKKNRNQFKPIDFNSVRFDFLEQKPVQTGLALFFSIRVRFSFSVPGLKNRNRTEPVGFFKILIGFFHGSVFLVIFF
jgi:hypothetical protein